ncbi:hypothetical protein [Acetatifactor aquisgranensis]|uniref:hypothetical protein n=1 Tax=Acetatifactor aquisgranensis TaxID=2941233 RepID=UPI00203AB39B|nr:hypothetical protein [Acetatifactor aquisgranensis]
MSEQGNGKPLEIGISVDRATAEEALRILNWYFDERPDQYLIQKPRTVYDSEGNARTTVRYLIKQREQAESEESNHDKQGTIQQ